MLENLPKSKSDSIITNLLPTPFIMSTIIQQQYIIDHIKPLYSKIWSSHRTKRSPCVAEVLFRLAIWFASRCPRVIRKISGISWLYRIYSSAWFRGRGWRIRRDLRRSRPLIDLWLDFGYDRDIRYLHRWQLDRRICSWRSSRGIARGGCTWFSFGRAACLRRGGGTCLPWLERHEGVVCVDFWRDIGEFIARGEEVSAVEWFEKFC